MDAGHAGGRDRAGHAADQRTVTAPLEGIAEAAAGLAPPAITLVGEVASLHERLAWFERRPLFGRRVVVTRARPQASGLARAAGRAGRRGGGGAGDRDRAASLRAAGAGPIRRRLRDQRQRRRAAAGGRRARACRRDRGGGRPGDGGGAGRAWGRGRRGARAGRVRRAGAGAGRRGRQAGAGGNRRGRPDGAARRPARRRCRGRGAAPVPHACASRSMPRRWPPPTWSRSPRRRPSRTCWPRSTTAPGRASGGVDRPGHQRDAACARESSRWSRPIRTTWRGWWRRCLRAARVE